MHPFVDGLPGETRVPQGLTVFYGKIYFHGYKLYALADTVSTFFLTRYFGGRNMFTMLRRTTKKRREPMFARQVFRKGLVFGRMTDEDYARFRFYPLKCLIATAGIAIVAASFVWKVIGR